MNNVSTSPFQNALAGGVLSNSAGLSSHQLAVDAQQTALLRQYNAAVAGTPFRHSPRLHLEVDLVTNGFVLAVGNERLIAKDIEELQQHFVAQIANLLLEDK